MVNLTEKYERIIEELEHLKYMLRIQNAQTEANKIVAAIDALKEAMVEAEVRRKANLY